MQDERRTDEESAQMQAEEVDMQRLQDEIRNLPVAEHVMYMMQSLSTLAVGRMGLGGEPHARRDLGQARLAVDAFKALLDVMEKAAPGEAAPLRAVLSQLQLAYVGALGDRNHDGAPEPANRDAAADRSGEPADQADGAAGDALEDASGDAEAVS